MYVNVYTCECLYLYVCECVYVCTCMCLYLYVCECVYVCTCMCLYLYVCECVAFICVNVYMCAFVPSLLGYSARFTIEANALLGLESHAHCIVLYCTV